MSSSQLRPSARSTSLFSARRLSDEVSDHPGIRRLETGLLGTAAFLVGMGIPFALPIVGRIPLSELVLLPVLLWMAWRTIKSGQLPHPVLASSWFRWLLIAGGVSLLGYVTSDLLNGTTLTDLARGWARWVFLAIDIVTLTYLLASNWSNLRYFVWGFAAGMLVSIATVGPQAEDYWKFGFAYPLSFVLPMIVPQRRVVLMAALMAALGALHIWLGSRSLGANCLLAGGLIWVPVFGTRVRRLVTLLSIAAAGVAIWFFYTDSGVGDRSVLSTTARTAMLEFSLESFAQSPLIGNGSWFTKGPKINAFFAHQAALRGAPDAVNVSDNDEIAIHSQLLIALAEAGILGGIFFFAYGALLTWGLVYATRHQFSLRPLIIILLLNGGWDYLMSTFSGLERIFIAVCCALVLILHFIQRQQATADA